MSLNEKKRLKERADDQARAEARKKDRAARKAKPLEFRDVTLPMLDGRQPPAPQAATPPAAPVAPSTAPAQDQAYEKAPPAPDVFLEEGIAVLADLYALLGGSAPAVVEHSPNDKVVR